MAHERLSQADEPGHALGPDRATLYTFSPSHYNLRAVWALDRAGIVPRKVRMLPMLHVPIMASEFIWRGIKETILQSPRDSPDWKAANNWCKFWIVMNRKEQLRYLTSCNSIISRESARILDDKI